ncbi:hypothetical protein CF15_07305 [Pyrodictium occultum]|uniref:DUF340 domain-containing protein n=1 Tax=Pyrodictium occultum TaxID=2309 RepID=A0A0V8RWS8_PYROC|nr:hypothetical protein CF15_07305 [Pyrodictium occultum]
MGPWGTPLEGVPARQRLHAQGAAGVAERPPLPQPAATLLVLLAGVAAGYAGLRAPEGLVEPLLAALILAAGVAVGGQLPAQEARLAQAASRGLLLAASTMAASASASAALAAFTGTMPPGAAAALGAAAGWYSLAGPALAAVDPVYGLVAFLANLAREAMHLAFYPALARRGLRVEGIAVGGATTMDTGLPVVALHGGPYEAAVALVHGVVITLVAPAVVPLLAAAGR